MTIEHTQFWSSSCICSSFISMTSSSSVSMPLQSFQMLTGVRASQDLCDSLGLFPVVINDCCQWSPQICSPHVCSLASLGEKNLKGSLPRSVCPIFQNDYKTTFAYSSLAKPKCSQGWEAPSLS